MSEIKVTDWISWDEAANNNNCSIELLGGFFEKGMRWGDYKRFFRQEFWSEKERYFFALRENIVRNKIKESGEWHQKCNGVPKFSDDTVACFSYRAWGDLLAAIWSSEEESDYDYLDFYMD